eukprot:SAG11_NODE_82_length_17639_cov_6.427594_6_plen_905_part_00
MLATVAAEPGRRSTEGDGGRATNLWRRLMRAHFTSFDVTTPAPVGMSVAPLGVGFALPPNGRLDTAALVQQARTMAAKGVSEVGLNTMWIDAGWCKTCRLLYLCVHSPFADANTSPSDCQRQPTPATNAINSCWTDTGNWSADPDRFHGTLRPVSDAVHAAKMKLLIWFEPERVPAGNTEVANMATKRGWLKEGLYNYAIPEARQWMFELLNRTITDYGIDIYRQDANMGYYYASWTAHEPDDRRGLTEAGHVAGMYEIFDKLRASHPGLMMDTCASGGRRIDIETLRRMAPLHRTDWGPSTTYSPAQAHNYGLSLWVPVHGPSNTPTDLAHFNTTAYLSTFASADTFGHGIKEGSWGNASASFWPDLLLLYRRLSVARPLLRGDFYPLTPYGLDEMLNETSWMAWQHTRAEETGGIDGNVGAGPVALVQAFRRYHAQEAARTFRLRGLDANATYKIVAWDDDEHKSAVHRTGADLSNDGGLEVRIGSTPGAAMLLIFASKSTVRIKPAAYIKSDDHAGRLAFDRPVVVKQGGATTHAWFPQAGAVVGSSAGTGPLAITTAVSFHPDGGGVPHMAGHTGEALVSWNAGRSYTHLGWHPESWCTLFDGTATFLDHHGRLHYYKSLIRDFTNTSFRGFSVRITANPNRTLSQQISGHVVYSGFPFRVARITWMGAIVPLKDGNDTALAQTVAFSFGTNEAGGVDENLAAFLSEDSGRTFRFQQVVALRNETLPQSAKGNDSATRWEGAGENDLLRLQDGSLLTVFRVDSCHPYWHSRSTDGGKVWSAPQPLAANVNGSVRPKLLLMPNGQPLLAGGRPGLFLWLGDVTATNWMPINVAAVHNSLTAHEPTWQYYSGFVNGTSVGLPCDKKGGPAGSTSYTSLLQVAPEQFVLHYDRLADGWKAPPG